MTPFDTATSDGRKIIHAGLFRMGTKSMAEAYQILGIKTFHALDNPMGTNWKLIEEAAEATWPSVPQARFRLPYERADWDILWGTQYEAFCDVAAPFTLELFKSYPDAKVVIVQREFDSWWPSFKSEILDGLFRPFANIQFFLVWHLLGLRAGHAMRKLIFGFFNAKSKPEIEAHGRESYNEYFRQIRSTVPPEQLLEYELGSGWQPLCVFLGKEIPDKPFPRSNDRKAHSNELQDRQQKLYLGMATKGAYWLVGIMMLGAAWMLFPVSKTLSQFRYRFV